MAIKIKFNDTLNCTSGFCLQGCSHLCWTCDKCHIEGGWGQSREWLENHIKTTKLCEHSVTGLDKEQG